MTRIRYNNENGLLVSKTPFAVNGSLVKVKLDVSRVEATVYDITTNSVLTTVIAANLATLKVVVKQTLRNLGVEFVDEVRNRGRTELLDLDSLTGVEVVPTTNQ